MKILVTKKGTVDCYEDDYENGEGDFVNSWDFDVRGEYDSAEDLIKAIVKATYLFDFKVDEFGFCERDMGGYCPVCTGAKEATDEEYEVWKKEMEECPELPFI